MKKIILFCSSLFLLSCSGSSTYEKAIADFVQTDRKGTKYDMKFKVLELKEIQKINVSDSLKILEDNFNSDKAKKIENLSQEIDRNKRGLENEKKSRFSLPTIVNLHQKNIDRNTRALDSIQNLSFINPYEGKKADDVLSIVVECKYSIVPPVINTTAEEMREFVLSPDGSKVYAAKILKGSN